MTEDDHNAQSERAFWQSIYDLDAEDFYNDEDSDALLDVVAAAAFLGLPIPKWAAQLFFRKITGKNSLEHSTWEEVFGHLHPPGTRLDALRRDREIGPIVFEQVNSLVSKGMPVTEAFEVIGNGPLPIGAAKAAKLYYVRQRILRAIVFEQVNSLASKGMPVTEAFEVIGNGPLPIDAAKAAKLYYGPQRILWAIDALGREE